MRAPMSLRHLERVAADMAPFTAAETCDEAELARLCPLLKVGGDFSVRGLVDHDCLKIDQHALMQGYARQLRLRGGRLVTNARIGTIDRRDGAWEAISDSGEHYRAQVVVNAAGAWADAVALMAGVQPLGLAPLRRTIITFDAPAGADLEQLPFTKTVNDELYFGAESGRLFASPMDEEPSDPCDSAARRNRRCDRGLADGGPHPCVGRRGACQMVGAAHLHARPHSGSWLRAGCRGVFLAGRAGRCRAPDGSRHFANRRSAG